MSYAYVLRRPIFRRVLSRLAANLTAVVAVSAIFGLKAYIDGQALARLHAEPSAFSEDAGEPLRLAAPAGAGERAATP